MYKQFCTVIIPDRDFWNIIAIVIALDTLNNDFKTIIASLLKIGNKTIDQIQSIPQSKETKNISKKTTGVVEDLTIRLKSSNNHKGGAKRKAGSGKEYYNFYKFRHYAQDCNTPNKQPYWGNQD